MHPPPKAIPRVVYQQHIWILSVVLAEGHQTSLRLSRQEQHVGSPQGIQLHNEKHALFGLQPRNLYQTWGTKEEHREGSNRTAIHLINTL